MYVDFTRQVDLTTRQWTWSRSERARIARSFASASPSCFRCFRLGMADSGFRVAISGSGLRFRVSASGFGFRISESCFGFPKRNGPFLRVRLPLLLQVFRFRIWDVGFKIAAFLMMCAACSLFRISCLVCRVEGRFGVAISGFGFAFAPPF